MIRYKIDILKALKEAGYNTNRMRKEKTISESTIQRIRDGVIVSPQSLDALCRVLKMQPGDLIMFIDEDSSINTEDKAVISKNDE